MMYNNWLKEWLQNYIKPSTKKRTFNQYSKIIKTHILPYLGDLKLEELTPLIIQKLITKLSINGNKCTGKGLSASYIRMIVSIIKNSLKAAHLISYLPNYTLDKVNYPKIIEKKIECFTINEQKKIEFAAKTTKKDKYLGIILCLYTGLRIGELLALTWNDIDFEKSILIISKTCYDSSEEGTRIRNINIPKTKNSIREIPLPTKILEMLKEMKKKSKCEFVIAEGEKFVFMRSYQRTFELLLKKLKIPHKGFHSLRHTFATRALECGMDVKTLSEILGHKNPTITLNRYVHSLWEHKKEMMNKLSMLL